MPMDAENAADLPKRASPAPISIDLWTWPLGATQDETLEQLDVLSDDERQRASRFIFVEDKRRFIAGRARLRQILAHYVALPPDALVFRYGVQGKPALSLQRAAPFFNLSHSGGLAALAVAQDCDIGIDIERLRPIERGVAKRFFSTGENAALQCLYKADWRDAFYRCWTRKEAVVKAVGKGLSLRLDSFEVSLHCGTPACVLHFDGCRDAGSEWSLVDLALGPGLVGAIAARTMGVGLSVRRRHWEKTGLPQRSDATTRE
jgi:4'-phosphopantetheinyl transferase